MSNWHDVRDWLGGWPMEFAGNKETENFCDKQLQLKLINIKAGEGNTEFLFQKTIGKTHFDKILAHCEYFEMQGPFKQIGKNGGNVILVKNRQSFSAYRF